MDSNSVLPLDVSKQVPVIDFSDKTLKPGSSKWEQVRSDVRKALEDYGCFEACFDKVSTELKKSVFEAVEEIFNLPTETKQRNVSSKPFHGYDCRDLYQSLGIEDANFVEKVNEFAQQLWPDHGNNNISETFHKFSEQLMELDMMVRRMIMESFRIEKYIDEHLSSTNYVLRMMKYTPPLEDDETKIGLQSHTDKNFLTILHQHQVGGLEVKTKDDTWIKVKPSQYSCLVMVGDSLYVAGEQVHHFQDCFDTLKKFVMKLNLDKCTFAVKSGEFLGYRVIKRRFEASPRHIAAILDLPYPRNAREVQSLTSRIVALNHFISQSKDKWPTF